MIGGVCPSVLSVCRVPRHNLIPDWYADCSHRCPIAVYSSSCVQQRLCRPQDPSEIRSPSLLLKHGIGCQQNSSRCVPRKLSNYTGQCNQNQNQKVNVLRAFKNQLEVSLVYCTNQTKGLIEKLKTKPLSSPVSVKAVRCVFVLVVGGALNQLLI